MTVRFIQSIAMLIALICGVPLAAYGIEPDCLIDSDPKLEIPETIRNFKSGLKALWQLALERPDADMQRMAAETIARAHLMGVAGLEETIPRLEAILTAEKSQSAARFAAARALIVLESRNSSAALWAASQRYGADLRQLVEPAIARWQFTPAKDVWLKRLEDPATRHRDLILALRGLARIRDNSALARLLDVTQDPLRDPVVRLEAAAAAGQTATAGLTEIAVKLSQANGLLQPAPALLAVGMLARHEDEAAQKLLIELAQNGEPAVAAAALTRLGEIDETKVLPLAESAMQVRDAQVRWLGASAYLNHPTLERIRPVAELLADPDPNVRRRIGDGLYRLCDNSELNAPIRQAASKILSEDRWQGQDQAARLLGALEHQPAASRLVELLESPRQEVAISAAWALRKVAVAETVPALIDKASRLTEQRKQTGPSGLDVQVVHLCEALGGLRASEALPLLRQYIPKRPLMDRSRSAAIWAIGRIKEGTRDAELENALSDRIRDFDDVKPESELVKQMCAVALVRMNAVEEAPMMSGIVKSSPGYSPLDITLRWAVKELTGKEFPPPQPLSVIRGTWFLEPLP